jgi:SAM-dependent methyltransferase
MAESQQPAGEQLSATGERLIPELQYGELVHAEHLARYHCAAQLARDRRVLDAACGDGYGTAILAGAGARSVIGVDLSVDAVEHARGRYASDFQVADIAALPFEDDTFDLVVSFETIEHVDDAPRVLAEFRRVLAGEGILVISTPNKQQYLVENEFHTREFTHDEFASLLSDRFANVEILLQHNFLASTVCPEEFAADTTGERLEEVDFYKLQAIRPGGELYSVAVCGNGLETIRRAVAVASTIDEAHELAMRLTSAERSAAEWHEEYAEAKRTAERWHRQFLEAERTSRRWHREFQDAQELAKELRTAYDETAATLETVYGSFSWRLTEPLRRVTSSLRGRRG